ncbi:unnamed protein product [Cuscuta epithymum]|uniref:Exocyst component Exo84 C-terminal domain-containing protein n=1 Tax=Cuscuta epithymum TaxID=186058 RepID=A0AAV0DH34_9ASTE|nr:unnamed protein product [Cuscuta epithymum]
MATVKSSRSRTHAAVTPAKYANRDTGTKLEEKLTVFNSDSFDADSFVQSKCHSLNEKEIRQLCSSLVDLKKASAEEMRRSVYANYTAFIRTSKEISDLEGELSSMKRLLSTQANLINNLAEGVHVDSLSDTSPYNATNDTLNDKTREPSEIEEWLADFSDNLDVLLAERRIDEALSSLDEGEKIALEAKQKSTLSPRVLLSLQTTITKRRKKLADQLADIAFQTSTRGAELRAAIVALKKLGDGPRAHSLLLNAHHKRYQYNMQSFRPSSTTYGGAYTAALSQLVFSAISQAASDSLTIFGKEPAYTSELVVWANKKTEDFAVLVKRHALSSSAAAGGLRAAAECVQIAFGHCTLLEARGLALCPVLLKLFRPSVEQALEANLKRIEESTSALAAADDWELTNPPSSFRQSAMYQHKLSSSAHRFYLMVQDFFEDVGPLVSMQLGGKAMDGLFEVFNAYVNTLIKALPGSLEEETEFDGLTNKIVRMAETEAQQITLLANATLLADELLPRASMNLSSFSQANYKDEHQLRTDRQSRLPEQREWKKRLVSTVDKLKDSFCQLHALELIFNEDGDSNLTADMYINLDGNADEIEWLPSQIFQGLFLKLNTIASIAADMFVGRERFATLLLMRLVETVMLWLSQDQSFWDDIQGPRPLGPVGLQQFYLDMTFVRYFASQGRYFSRNLNRIVGDIRSRAVSAFSSTGMDPLSVLPEEDWFTDICQDAVDRLSGRPRVANGERDLNSPTASVSAQSISSVRSHGSY